MVIQETISIQKKLEILSDAAKYDVACTSSGVDRKGNGSSMGNSIAAGICHTFQLTVDVSLFLRSYIRMNVPLIVNIVLIVLRMI